MSHDLQAAFDPAGLHEFRQRVNEQKKVRAALAEKQQQMLETMPWEEYEVTSAMNCPLCHRDRYASTCHGQCAAMGDMVEQQQIDPLRKARYLTATCLRDYVIREKLVRLQIYRAMSGLVEGRRNSEFQHTFANWQVTAANHALYEFLQSWDSSNDAGIYIASMPTEANPTGNGIGKSYALHALTNRLCEEGVKARFCRTSDFLRDIRETYNADCEADESDILQKFSKIPVLLWDDMGKEQIRSEWGAEKFYQVIDDRCRYELPTVISSNFWPDILAQRFGANFGPAIVSRIAAMCPHMFALAGNDRRFEISP